jgi:hypothetical protein
MSSSLIVEKYRAYRSFDRGGSFDVCQIGETKIMSLGEWFGFVLAQLKSSRTQLL